MEWFIICKYTAHLYNANGKAKNNKDILNTFLLVAVVRPFYKSITFEWLNSEIRILEMSKTKLNTCKNGCKEFQIP